MMNLDRFSTIEPQFDHGAGFLTIWLNRPDARNALSGEMVEELRALLDDLKSDLTVRAVIFRGRGKVFCAGGDLKGFQAAFSDQSTIENVAKWNREAGYLFEAINTLPQVVIMAVHGAAMAGGLGMVCAGDVVIVTRDAKFALTETTLGIPPAQIAPFVEARLGQRIARRLMLTAAQFSGDDAERFGLADEVVENEVELTETIGRIVAQVRKCAPSANAATKGLLISARSLSRNALADKAATAFATCLLSEEGREGVSAFTQKRKAVWAHPSGEEK
ncbi:MAG: enoyl-CoA hydratase-related protein [Pseudomonadota bacterium]